MDEGVLGFKLDGARLRQHAKACHWKQQNPVVMHTPGGVQKCAWPIARGFWAGPCNEG